jgi:hypothetical protein
VGTGFPSNAKGVCAEVMLKQKDGAGDGDSKKIRRAPGGNVRFAWKIPQCVINSFNLAKSMLELLHLR